MASRSTGTRSTAPRIRSGCSITAAGPLLTRQVYVHDNVMTLRAPTTRVGAVASTELTELFGAAAGNRFDRNTYRVLDPSRSVLGVERPDAHVEPVAGVRPRRRTDYSGARSRSARSVLRAVP